MLIYIECKMGAAGDMLMSALYELLSEEQKRSFTAAMNSIFGEAVQIEPESKTTCGISGTHIHVNVLNTEETGRNLPDDSHNASSHEALEHEHCHKHSHDHHHYTFQSVKHIIEGLDIDEAVKSNAIQIYEIIGRAEAKVHNAALENIHFHEVGSLDAMADVVGCSLLFSYLKPDEVICSPIHVGNGTVKCAHGILPVPAPATTEILKGVPYYTGSINSELCTPTGAAIIKHFATDFSDMPSMTIRNTGYGIGNKQFETANAVRIFAGERYADSPSAYTSDKVLEISCNLDDMTGEELGYAMEVLLNANALDVFYTPIYMKKSRPAVMFSCLCHHKDRDKFTDLIFKHTTTRGLRYTDYTRSKLISSFNDITTSAGTVREKISFGKNMKKSKLEFEDLKKLAQTLNISIWEARKLARQYGSEY